MFPKTNNEPKKNQQPRANDENVRKEALEEDQKSVQPMGNEGAMNFLSNLIRAANDDNELDISQGPEEDQIIDRPNNISNSNNIDNIISLNDANRNNNIIYNFNSRNAPAKSEEKLPKIDTGSDKTGQKANSGGENASSLNIIKQAVQQIANAPANEEESREFYEDPAGPDLESLDPENPLNRDMVVEAPKKKGKKSRGRKKSSGSQRSGNDLNNVNEDMQLAAGWNFNAQKLPARKKAGWFRRFLTGTSYYAGKSIGKVFNFIMNLAYVPLTWSFGKLWRSRSGNKEHAQVTQEKRDHDTIPGWNGAKYEKGAGGNDEVIADFRRVPTVWSYLTASQAADEKNRPLPPKVGVYVRQPKEGEDKDIDWADFGHSGIGIEYSRYSRQTKRYERYGLRYGFYQAGATVSGGVLTNSSNVIVPGTLADEHDSTYTVSRQFKATARQVNDILKASETWADKGYNAATRNCTTFVKTMVRDVAHLPLASDIFTEDHLRLNSLGNFGYFGSSASDINAQMGMESQFKKLGQQEDMSYAHFGNKRFTKQEYRQYKDTLAEGHKRITTADTPNSAAENMRRLEGKYAGSIGSQQFSRNIPRDANKSLVRTFENVSSETREAGQEVAQAIMTITGKNEQQMNAMYAQAREMVEIFSMLQNGGLGSPILEARDAEDPESLRLARKNLNDNIDFLNKLLFDYFKNDKRLHIPVMHAISLLNYGADMIDHSYNEAVNNQKDEGELGNIRGDMFSYAHKISSGDAESFMSPSHYESYIQIYKTSQEAVAKYARYQELKEWDEDPNRQLTKAEKKEYEKAKRIDKLADQFDQSQRYMLEKSSFSQQDVDYAFSLGKKEKADGEAAGLLIDKWTAGDTYQALIMEKIFGGMKQRYLEHIPAEEARNLDLIRNWLDDDVNRCINRKKNEFIAVLRAIARASDTNDMEMLRYDLNRAIFDSWFLKVFKHGDQNSALSQGANYIGEAFGQILADDQSPVKKTVDGIFKFVLAEDEHAKPDALQAVRNKAGKGKQ